MIYYKNIIKNNIAITIAFDDSNYLYIIRFTNNEYDRHDKYNLITYYCVNRYNSDYNFFNFQDNKYKLGIHSHHITVDYNDCLNLDYVDTIFSDYSYLTIKKIKEIKAEFNRWKNLEYIIDI